MKAIKGMFCVLSAGLILFAQGCAPAQAIRTWTQKCPMAVSRDQFQAQAANGKIYALGGLGADSKSLSSVECYNPTENKWTVKKPMREARTEFQSQTVNGKIYAMGGWSSQKQTDQDKIGGLSSMESYDPTIDLWSPKAPMSVARSAFLTENVNGIIYAMGGVESANTMEAYHPETDTWSSKAQIPAKISAYDCRTAVLNGKIYAIGQTVQEYDPKTDVWTVRAPMLTARYKFQVLTVGGKLYALGGSDGSGHLLSSMEEYEPETDKWTAKASMSVPRMEFQAEAVGKKIYAVGGSDEKGVLSTVEKYDPDADKWTEEISMITPRHWFQTKTEDGKIYAIGGWNVGEALSSTEEYTP